MVFVTSRFTTTAHIYSVVLKQSKNNLPGAVLENWSRLI